MEITINLKPLTAEQINEIMGTLTDSFNDGVESDENQTNYEAAQILCEHAAKTKNHENTLP